MTYDVVVVGGGIAGLSAASYACRAGQSVLVIEQQPKVGGLVQSIQRNGYTFDSGLRAVENAGIVLPFFKDLGISLEYTRSTVSVGIKERIIHITSKNSLLEYERLLHHYYPDSSEDIATVMHQIRRIMKSMDVMYGIDNPLFGNAFSRPWYFISTLIPWAIKFLFTIRKINRMQQPVEDFLAEIVKNRSLRDILGQHFFKGTPAFFAMSYFSVYLDYVFPKGGTGRLSEILYEDLKKKGVIIKLGKKIHRIDVDRRYISDADGAVYSYKHLIWAGDMKSLYNQIETKSPEFIAIVENKKWVLNKHRGSDSVFCLNLCLNKEPGYFGQKSTGHLFYSPSSKGLADIHKGELAELINRIENSLDSKKLVSDWLYRFFYYNSLEISIPVLKDSSMAPKDKTGLMVLTLFSYDLTKAIYNAGWYDEFKKMCEDAIIRILEQSMYPGLSSWIEESFSVTPMTVHRLTGNSEGAITGWEFAASNPAVRKIQHTGRAVKTPFKSISAAGQWTYSPAGVPMSILTGKLAAERAVKNIRR